VSVIKVEDIAFVRFAAPDLDEMRAFLVEFGLRPLPSEDGILYARGAGSAPFLHATSLGAPAFAALGLRAASVADLERLAAATAKTVETLAAPGGGKVVRLTDPDGCAVEVVAGQEPAEPAPIAAPAKRNSAQDKARLHEPVRVPPGPATVIRLGHAVLEVKDFSASETWYKSLFGFITSDEIEMAPGMALGAFLRCDRGARPTDHHTLFLLQSPAAPRFNHAAFEVADMDDLMSGHGHLKSAGRTPAWGVGRHILGSQIFDYWKDPWGAELEHWTDGDLLIDADGSRKASLHDLIGVQWGQAHPMLAQAQGKTR